MRLYGTILILLCGSILTSDITRILNKDYISDIEYSFDPNSLNEDMVCYLEF